MEKGERDRLVREEEKKLRRMQLLVNLTTSALYQDSSLSLEEAREMVRNTEKAVLNLFPDKQTAFDIILRPRFERILYERWGAGLESTIH